MSLVGRKFLVVILLSLIVSTGPILAQTLGGGRPYSDELAPTPARDLIGPPTLPEPVEPRSPLMTVTWEFQLVGFTSADMPSNKGVLNYTRACQREFPTSRMCTISDVNRTVMIPAAPGYGHAWVRQDGALGYPLTLPSAGPARSGTTPTVSTDCNGWTNDSTAVLGTVMDFGSDAGCYGGYHAKPCDMSFVVACCALAPVSTEVDRIEP